MPKHKVICIVGPTASGKTSLGAKVGLHFGGEVISADSMQVYNNMPIASAAPTDEETMGVKHHLVGFLSPNQKFSVAEFINKANESIDKVLKEGKLPILVGGTGLYIDSLLQGVKFCDEDSTEIRKALEEKAEKEGIEVLFERLKALDPETASKLHINDRKRIIRALEVYELHGKTLSELNLESKPEGDPYDVIWIGITYADREKLYDRINLRVDKMLENGLLEEACVAYKGEKGATSVQAIGHKEFFPFFAGEITLDEATERLKTETRRYAKRQLTWFRRNKNINWIFADETEDVFLEAKRIIEENLK